jgi:hypothetical protein
MALDIKKEVEELVQKIQKNPKLMNQFMENPIKVVEDLIGIDLPDAEIKKLADLVKAKIDLDKAGDLLKGLGGLFK